MRALLLKDFYTLKRQAMFMLVLIILFALIPNTNGMMFSFLSIVYAAMLPITTMGYDERARWDRVAATMPYRRAEVVLSRYVLGLICVGGAATLVLIAAAVRSAFVGGAPDAWETLGTSATGLCFGALVLPFMHWLGVEKGRLAYISCVAVLMAVIFALNATPGGRGVLDRVMGAQGGWLLAGALVLNVLSALLSVWLYKRRAL